MQMKHLKSYFKSGGIITAAVSTPNLIPCELKQISSTASTVDTQTQQMGKISYIGSIRTLET